MSHPIIEAASAVRDSLKAVGDANPTFMATEEKAQALIALAAVEAQLAELRLRILVDAGDLAESTGARDPAGWLAHHTRIRSGDASADLALATALDRRHPVLAGAMRQGAVNLAQARVIGRALGGLHDLPEAVGADVLARAEERLVACAADFGPEGLARLGRRILEVVAPEIAEEAEARRLAEQEANAALKTRLTMHRLGDGTTRLSGRLPDAAATRLATFLEAFTNPRRQTGDAQPSGDPFTRLPYPRRLGEAMCSFLECIDPARLPLHGGDATTLVVTLSLDALLAELGTAELLGAGLVPGDETTGDQITAAQARRLACTAKIIPAVLDGDSLPLDLGRAQRLFSPAQRKALLLRDKTCRAEGCDIPGTWAEAHHLVPWSTGGRTDLANAVLLCSHHHHRVHDPGHGTDLLPNGDLRFHRRR